MVGETVNGVSEVMGLLEIWQKNWKPSTLFAIPCVNHNSPLYLTSPTLSAADLIGSLRITEIMYNPAGANGVEFVELKNIGLNSVNLSDDAFSSAVSQAAQIFFCKISGGQAEGGRDGIMLR